MAGVWQSDWGGLVSSTHKQEETRTLSAVRADWVGVAATVAGG